MEVASSYIRSLGCDEIPLSDALRALSYYPSEDPFPGDGSYIVIEGQKLFTPIRGFELLEFVIAPRMREKWGRYEEAEEFTHPLGINARYAGKKSSRTLVRYRSFRPYIPFGILKDVAKTENAQLFLFMCKLQKEAEQHNETKETAALTTDRPKIGWQIALYDAWPAMRKLHGREPSASEAIRYLKKYDDSGRILQKGGDRELWWKPTRGTDKEVQFKTVESCISSWRTSGKIPA